MKMYLSEIVCVCSKGDEHLFSGPIVKANSYEEAQVQARRMNKDLYIVGEYFGNLGAEYEHLGIS